MKVCIENPDISVQEFMFVSDLVNPPKETPKPSKPKEKPSTQLTAEEEAELAELMEDD